MGNPEAVFNTLRDQVGILALGFGAIFSLMQCFFGYKLRKLWIACAGFFIGFGAGALLSAFLLPANRYTLLLVVLIGLAAGGLLALTAVKLYHAGIFLYAFFIVFTTVAGLFPDKLSWLGLLIGLAAGIAAGILTLRFFEGKTQMEVAGEIGISQQLLSLFGVSSLPVILGVGTAAALLGLITQFILNPRYPERGAGGRPA